MSKEYSKIKPKNVARVTEDDENVEKKVVRKVATASVKKPGLVRRFFIGIGGPDVGSNITKYLMNEIIVPAVKDIIFNTITSGTKMAIYGDDYHTSDRRSGYSSNIRRVGYTDYSSKKEPKYAQPREYSKNRVEDLVMPTREEAKSVLDQLLELSGKYQFVTVADYYDMFDGVKTSPTHVDWGWAYDQILSTSIVPVRGGFVLNLPSPVEV